MENAMASVQWVLSENYPFASDIVAFFWRKRHSCILRRANMAANKMANNLSTMGNAGHM